MANGDTGAQADENKVMDYPEHEKTYEMFLSGSKIVTVTSVALLAAMAFGFFAGGGFIGGSVVFIALLILSWFIL
ncbi:MAG: aa3-type cytochrome c oxidase subunit IV [Ahrensia sp.]